MKEKLKKHKKLIIVLFLVIVVVILAFAYTENRKKNRKQLEAMVQQETAPLERRTLMSSISATGTVKSVASKQLVVPLSNVEVLSVDVEVGDLVEEGDVVCVFDSGDLEQNLADAQASLASSSGKSGVDVSSAQRYLSEAETTRNIEAERASQNVADAWEDYLKSLTKLEEAEDDWNEAINTRNEKKGEYEYRQKLLEEAKAKMENAKSSTGQSSQAESGFNETWKAFKSYVESNSDSITANNGAMDKIYLTSTDLPEMSVEHGDFTVTSDDSGEKTQAINGYLSTLKGYQTKYQSGASADAAYQQALSEYQAMEQEAAAWKTKYETADKSVSSYESAYDQAESTAESYLDAYKKQVQTQEDTTRNNDSSVASKNDSLTTAKLNASVSGLSDQQKIRSYEEQIEDCTVKAPMSGVVTAVNIEKGDVYNGTAILTIEDDSAYEIAAEIDEYDIGKVQVGQQVIIKTNGTGDEELEGTVTQIAPRASTGGSEVTYQVIISVDTPNDQLRMDMTAKLSIVLESRENVLTVPYEAVQEKEDGTSYIEVVKADSGTEGATEEVTVQKGIESDYYIEVSGENLSEGMEVVIPSEGSDDNGLQQLIERRGAMGGF